VQKGRRERPLSVPQHQMIVLFARLSDGAGSELGGFWRQLAVAAMLGWSDHCEGKWPLRLVDTQGDAGVAIDRLISHELSENINFILGATLSAVANPLSSIATVRGVPSVSYSATSIDLSGGNRLFARTVPSDEGVAEVLCVLLSEQNINDVGLVFLDDDYGTAYRDTLTHKCARYDVGVHGTSIQSSSLSSITFAMDFVNGLNLNVVIMVAFSDAVPEILARGGPETIFIGSDAVTDDGIKDFINRDPVVNSIFVQKRVLRIQAVGHNDGQMYADFKSRWLTLQENTTLFDRHLESEGLSPLSPTFFQDTLSDVGLFVPFAYDAASLVCRSLKVSNASELADTVNLNEKLERGRDLFNTMLDLDFDGVSGSVRIDDATHSREVASASFVLQRFTSTGLADEVPAGTWIGTGWNLDHTQRIEFPEAVSVSLDANYLSNAAKIASVFFASMLVLWTLGLIVFTWMKRKTRIMTRAQPRILILFLVGVVVSLLSTFFMGNEDLEGSLSIEFLDFSCMAVLWFWSIGTVITFGALTAKLYRIYRIFNNKFLRRIRITITHLYVGVLAIVLVDVLILMVWSLVAPLKWRKVVSQTDIFGNPTLTYGECYSGEATPFLIVLLAYTFTLFVVGLVFSFKVRNIPSDFQEGGYIIVSLIGQFQLYLLGFLLIFVFSESDTTARFLVMITVVFFNNLVLTLVIYVPKFNAMRHNVDRANSLNDFTSSSRSLFGNSNHNNNNNNAALKEDLDKKLFPRRGLSGLASFGQKDAAVQCGMEDLEKSAIEEKNNLDTRMDIDETSEEEDETQRTILSDSEEDEELEILEKGEGRPGKGRISKISGFQNLQTNNHLETI